jgi:hypothetical protein
MMKYSRVLEKKKKKDGGEDNPPSECIPLNICDAGI